MVRRTCILYIYDLFFGCLHNSLFTGICKIGYVDQRQKKKKKGQRLKKKKGQRPKTQREGGRKSKTWCENKKR